MTTGMSLYRSQDSIGTVASGADAMACEVLSAGGDKSLRMFHTALDRQNRELSQGERVRCIFYAIVCVVVCVFSYIFFKRPATLSSLLVPLSRTAAVHTHGFA